MEQAFSFVSGHAGLDLVGTVGRWHRPEQFERLTSPERLGAWIREAGLLDEAPALDAEGLTATLTLRAVIYRLALARIEHRPADPADLDALNATAAAPPVTVALRATGPTARTGDLAQVRATIARQTVELLGGPDADRMKLCGDHKCTRMYLDTSRRGDRRWCDMRDCGNRAKATAYRRRQGKSQTGATPNV
ncbi:MAG TPA: ABATE domain-containing protein [Pseudonocardia sp.]|jgi:predicted RNA-binding Zn ribbon-like protein